MKLLQKDVPPAVDKYTCACDGRFEQSHIQEWTDRDKFDVHFKSEKPGSSHQNVLSPEFYKQISKQLNL